MIVVGAGLAGVLTATAIGAAARPLPAGARGAHTVARSEEIGATGAGTAVPAGCRETAQRSPRGWRYTPIAAARPLPAVVMLHKGFAYAPQRAARATRDLGRNVAQHLCPLGIVVSAVDYRAGAIGRDEMHDVNTAFDALAATGSGVDPARVALLGGSHGGYMALLALARHERPFAGAAVFYAFADPAWVLARHILDNPSTRQTVARFGDPHRDRARYAPIIVDVARIDQPLLLITGDRDQFVADMRRLRRTLPGSSYLEIPGAPHGFEVGPTPATALLWQRVTAFAVTLLGLPPT